MTPLFLRPCNYMQVNATQLVLSISQSWFYKVKKVLTKADQSNQVDSDTVCR